jgi:hypothetical protein
MDKVSSALVLIAYMSWQVWNHPDLLILAQEEKDSRKEDNVENFIVDKDDDVPDVVVTDHGASDGVIVLNDDNGVDGTVKGGRLYYIFLAFSILLFFFLSPM